MRALILGLSAVIVGLVALIIKEIDSRATPSPLAGRAFEAGQLIGNALPGESATYREVGGRARTRAFTVEYVVPPEQGGVPLIRIKQATRTSPDPNRLPKVVSYDHRVTDHFWFPLTAPGAPEAKDRIWILRRISEDTRLVQGRERACWRVDLIDPALPADSDTVVAWVDPDVPVFGLLEWQRGGETWVLVGSKGGR